MRILKTIYCTSVIISPINEVFLDELREYYIGVASQYLLGVRCSIDPEKVLTRIKFGDSTDLRHGKEIAYVVNRSNERIGHLLLIKSPHHAVPCCQVIIDTKHINDMCKLYRSNKWLEHFTTNLLFHE